MKYIKMLTENKLDDKKKRLKKRKKSEEELNKQTNLIVDQILRDRDFINNRINDIYGIDVGSEDYKHNHMKTPNPFMIMIDGTDINGKSKSIDYNVFGKENISSLRSWGQILKDLIKCEIDFFLGYVLFIDVNIPEIIDDDIPNYIKRIDQVEHITNKQIECINLTREFIKDLGNFKIEKIQSIEKSKSGNKIAIMFQLKRKNKIIIDNINILKQINN